MCHLDKIQFEIVSGQYQTADLEEKQMIRELMGDNAEYDYEIYFHWYNIIHELVLLLKRWYDFCSL